MRAVATADKCTACGTKLLPNDRFCSGCGARTGGNIEPVVVVDPLLERLRRATIGKYDMHSELGRGGMAAVYLAYDIALQRKVAVKVMLPELFLSEGMADRFLLEARTAARLAHPNIVVIHAVSSSDDLFYFVMRLIEGGAVDDLLKIEPMMLPLPEVKWVLSQAARALHHAHGEGVVHRDVKPANIMVNTKGEVVLTDFGIAKASESPHLTRTGTAVGTPAYMSPEQVLVTDITMASDQYSLGIVAYEMLTGRAPFRGSALEVQWAHAHHAAPDIVALNPSVPAELAAAVMRMLEKKPQNRWQSLDDVIDIFSDGLPRGASHPRVSLAARAQVAQTKRAEKFSPTPRSPLPKLSESFIPTAGKAAPVEQSADVAKDVEAKNKPTTRVNTKLTSITRETHQFEVGQTATLGFDLHASDGDVQVVCSDSSIVDIDDDGIVRALAPGTASITVIIGDEEILLPFIVVPAARVPTELRLLPASINLEPGDSTTLTVSAHDATDDTPLAYTDAVSWTVVDASVVSCSAAGVITALKSGSTTVRATLGTLEREVPIVVQEAVVAKLSIGERAFSLPVRETRRMEVRAFDKHNKSMSGDIRYDSNRPDVASVDKSGEIRAVAVGKAIVTLSAAAARVTIDVTVLPAAVAELRLSPSAVQMEIGEAVRLGIQAFDAAHVELGERAFSWTSSDAGVVSVDRDGVLRAVAAGVSTISATVDGISAHVSVRVAAVPLRELRVDTTNATLVRGRTQKLEVHAVDARGNEAFAPVTWASRNTVVVTVTDGIVHARAVGSTSVIATSGAISSQEIRVTVTAPTPVRLEFQKSVSTLRTGQSASLQARVLDDSGAAIDDATVLWSSSDSSVVSVDATGNMAAHTPGRASITASSGALQLIATVAVQAPRKFPMLPVAIGSAVLVSVVAIVMMMSKKEETPVGGDDPDPGVIASQPTSATTTASPATPDAPLRADATPAVTEPPASSGRTFTSLSFRIDNADARGGYLIKVGASLPIEARAADTNRRDSLLVVESSDVSVVSVTRGRLTALRAGNAVLRVSARGVRTRQVSITVTDAALVAQTPAATPATVETKPPVVEPPVVKKEEPPVVAPPVTLPVAPPVTLPVTSVEATKPPPTNTAANARPRATENTPKQFSDLVARWLSANRDRLASSLTPNSKNKDLERLATKLKISEFDQSGFSVSSLQHNGNAGQVQVSFPSVHLVSGAPVTVTVVLAVNTDGSTVTTAGLVGNITTKERK